MDIDLFTDAEYGSIDFAAIQKYLEETYTCITTTGTGAVGIGQSYFVGHNEHDLIKLDLFYTDDFIDEPLVSEGIRMATIDEIIAMKVDVV